MKLIQVRNHDLADWLPLTRFTRLQDELSRLFDAPLAGRPRPTEVVPDWTPALDVTEQAESFVIQTDLPGVRKDAVTVTYQNGVLVIAGERKPESTPEGVGGYRTERRFGRFQRSIELLKPVAADQIKAGFQDGVLTITLPKTEEAKPKPIAIQVG